ncbi:cell division protein FtsB [Moritella sp. F3]|uniref:cell division protein FtsB n=1 Tax=Moritella sp. F3 TaxID=2718882 RepID=UPI0018E1C3C2|nr:cell division protein FtsB [Moritella sp. F3]GIC77906.1 cell division protein FtsB [Moritella sp. F1]GIC82405.1 cell division protein FtsB [Moritella sp. F3]
MRLLYFVLILILSLLLYHFVAGNNGLMDYKRIEREVDIQYNNNQVLLERNTALKNEILDLRNGNDAIEERTRNELGMIKKGETFYRIINDDDNN